MGGLKLTEDRAEQLKIEHGNAINERPGGAPLSADQVDINQFVHARTGEIIANVIHQAEAAGYKVGDLPAGIVAVGGGARMRNFLSALSTQSKMRVRHGVADPQIHLCQGLDPDVDVDIIALLKAAAAMPGNSCLFLDRTLVEKTEPESGHRPDDEAAADNYRRPVNESDSDLLDDDPDDEFEARPPKKQGWFSRMLNRRKADERREQLLEDARRDEEERRERQRQRREDQETIDPMADEDDSDDMAEIDYAETKSLIGKFKNKVTSYLERGTEADLDDRNN